MKTKSTAHIARLPIGVFDSGIGGLTVAREIAQVLPHESITYFGDTARCPYGPREQSEVANFVHQITSWLVKEKVKLIVIACNTATAAGLAQAQMNLDIPVIGVINPGARAAIQTTTTQRVGVIGTTGTVNSHAYSNAITELDAGVHVFEKATPDFVELAENLMASERTSEDELLAHLDLANDYLTPLLARKIDTLVLACTHFPLLYPLIRKAVGEDVAIISSAEETARDVKDALSRREWLADEGAQPEYRFVTTLPDTHGFARVGSRVFGHVIKDADYVSVLELEAVARSVEHDK